MKATKVGKMRCRVEQLDWKSFEVVLTDVKYVPELWVNLFSIGKGLSNGFQIGNKGVVIHLTKGKTKLSFDRILQTKKGYVLGVDMVPVNSQVAGAVLERGKKIDVNKLHQMLGHCGEDSMRLTAKANGWELSGKMETCIDCAI